MNDSLISIIVPVYNVEKYVRKCIDSLISQTYFKLEIILIDDGSTDNSGKICDEYSLKDVRIKVIHKENGGLSDARNAGLRIMQGKYVFFVDSDDWLHVKAIQILYDNMVRCDCDIAIGNFRRVTNHLEKINRESSTGKLTIYELSKKQALEEMLKQEKYTCSAWGRLFKVELFENIEFPVGKLFEDQGTTYKLFLKSNKICFVDFPIYAYFVRNGSIQNSQFKIANMDELEFAIKQKIEIDKIYPELQGATAGRLISTCFHIMYGIEDIKQYKEYYEEAKNYIIKYRKQAIWDKRTGKKVKIGCLMSYFGFHFTRCLYCLTGVRGKLIR